jgi:hypothetical protein
MVFEYNPPVGSIPTRTLSTLTPKLRSQATSSVKPSALVGNLRATARSQVPFSMRSWRMAATR